MKRWLWLVVVVAVAAPLVWWLTRPPAPREVPFARASRKKLVSTIVTNGKVEPEQFAAVRAPQEGAIVRVMVEKGQTIVADAVVAELDSSAAQTELRAAEARVAQARAELKLYEAGGSAQSRAELAGATESTRVQLESAKRESARLERLVKQNAETRETLTAAQDRVRQLETELASLQNRQTALLPVGGREAADARVREAQVAVESARRRMEQSLLRALVGGTVYNVAVKKGAFVRPGDLIAEVGQIRTVRVTVYVDEPELGKVGAGMPVEIRWDAQPGRTWNGTVDRLPTQIVSLNTRQVGEVLCLIDNKEGQLPPGANVNVEIRSATAENAMSIPKAAIRRDNGTGVLLLSGDHVEWRPIKIGITSVTDAQVTDGLKDNEAVALPTETPLKAGEKVAPRFP